MVFPNDSPGAIPRLAAGLARLAITGSLYILNARSIIRLVILIIALFATAEESSAQPASGPNAFDGFYYFGFTSYPNAADPGMANWLGTYTYSNLEYPGSLETSYAEVGYNDFEGTVDVKGFNITNGIVVPAPNLMQGFGYIEVVDPTTGEFTYAYSTTTITGSVVGNTLSFTFTQTVNPPDSSDLVTAFWQGTHTETTTFTGTATEMPGVPGLPFVGTMTTNVDFLEYQFFSGGSQPPWSVSSQGPVFFFNVYQPGQFAVSAPTEAIVGVPIIVTVTALGAMDDQALPMNGFDGIVQLTSSDPAAMLPAALAP